jgi:hypothetical protein
LRLGDVAETDAQKRDAVEVTMSSQIEKLNGNIAKPLVTGCCGQVKGNPNDDIKKAWK